MVAGELGVVILPASTAQFYTRPDVTYRPVEDLAPNQVALAYQADRDSPELRAMEDIVQSAWCWLATDDNAARRPLGAPQ
jgi:LysR substrate binding domain